MKTLAVHPAVMKRIQSGNVCNIVTRYEFKESEPVEVITDDEVVSVRTRIKSVEKKNSSLFYVTLEDPATAFIE